MTSLNDYNDEHEAGQPTGVRRQWPKRETTGALGAGAAADGESATPRSSRRHPCAQGPLSAVSGTIDEQPSQFAALAGWHAEPNGVPSRKCLR